MIEARTFTRIMADVHAEFSCLTEKWLQSAPGECVSNPFHRMVRIIGMLPPYDALFSYEHLQYMYQALPSNIQIAFPLPELWYLRVNSVRSDGEAAQHKTFSAQTMRIHELLWEALECLM